MVNFMHSVFQLVMAITIYIKAFNMAYVRSKLHNDAVRFSCISITTGIYTRQNEKGILRR